MVSLALEIGILAMARKCATDFESVISDLFSIVADSLPLLALIVACPEVNEETMLACLRSFMDATAEEEAMNSKELRHCAKLLGERANPETWDILKTEFPSHPLCATVKFSGRAEFVTDLVI